MLYPRFEPLESRQLLSGSTCGDDTAAAMTHDAHASHMVPLGYTYPDPGGGGSGGGGGSSTGGSTSSARDFTAKLRGNAEVPARSTSAKGTATFRLNRAGTSLTFTIKVSGIRNVTAAHLHLGAKNVNGGVVAHLYGPESPGGGRRSGTLATGTIKTRDLMGSLDGKPLKKLINAIKNGKVYVNVHTDDGNGSSDTGAGDYASGEIRGQVKRA
jgi:hypothetical protein